jgi:hypothetical protein
VAQKPCNTIGVLYDWTRLVQVVQIGLISDFWRGEHEADAFPGKA